MNYSIFHEELFLLIGILTFLGAKCGKYSQSCHNEARELEKRIFFCGGRAPFRMENDRGMGE